MIAVREPRSVIRREDEQRVFFQLLLLQRLHHLAHRPVDLFDHIAEETALRLACKLLRNMQRHMRHVVREVEEERLLAIRRDELHRALRVFGCEPPLIRHQLHHVCPRKQRQRRIVGAARRMIRPHVVRVRQAVVIIESVRRREERCRTSQVPLPVNRRGVAAVLQQSRQRHLICVQSDLRARPQRAEDAHAIGITSRQQRRARRRAHRLRHVEIREANASFGKPVDVRRLVALRAEATHIRVGEIIAKDDDHIRQARGCSRGGQRSDQACDGERCGEELFHELRVA